MSWTPIDDSETPNWNGIPELRPGSFQVGAFQTNYQQNGTATIWGPVNDAQTSGWSTINDTQTPGWAPVPDTQTPGWH